MIKRTSSIHNPKYKAIITELIKIRKETRVLQADIATALGLIQLDISKIERCERRLDIIELFDYLNFWGKGDEAVINDYWNRINNCTSGKG